MPWLLLNPAALFVYIVTTLIAIVYHTGTNNTIFIVGHLLFGFLVTRKFDLKPPIQNLVCFHAIEWHWILLWSETKTNGINCVLYFFVFIKYNEDLLLFLDYCLTKTNRMQNLWHLNLLADFFQNNFLNVLITGTYKGFHNFLFFRFCF